ncbi:MAG: hypothetical protein U0414_22900 [Polyangiaceae bacterium]
MSRRRIAFTVGMSLAMGVTASLLVAACDDGSPDDRSTGSTTSSGSTSSSSVGSASSGTGGSGSTSASSSSGGPSCLDAGHAAGDRYPVGDDCNFCECNADGTTTCTSRTCPSLTPGCTYAGMNHAYAEHFPSTDACNDCVCAASGLACTRRPCTTVEEGAILVESLDTPCGSDPNFTAKAVLAGLPVSDVSAPFPYDKTDPKYPETLPETTVRVRVVYDGGFAVCRIPAPGQEAFDIEVLAEWITKDGSFDEGFHTYLRRNAGGFTNAWYLAMSAPKGGLDGTFDPNCFDDNGFSFDATFDASGTVDGSVYKTCETDFGVHTGSFHYP